jgi:hypothetical protein
VALLLVGRTKFNNTSEDFWGCGTLQSGSNATASRGDGVRGSVRPGVGALPLGIGDRRMSGAQAFA